MTIYDIAKACNVSAATVSRVINHKGNVSAKTTEKIENCLRENGFSPSMLARGLSGQSMKLVAIITTDIRASFSANVIYHMEKEFSVYGYNVVVCNVGTTIREKTACIQLLAQKGINGIVFIGSALNDQDLQMLLSEHFPSIPIVLANGQLNLPNSYSVTVDDAHGTALCVEHLIERGRRHIAFVKTGDSNNAIRKLSGYKQAMRSAGLVPHDSWMITVSEGLAGAKEAYQQLLQDSKLSIDGIVCSEDITALGILQQLHQAGKHIPEELSVIGFGNTIHSLCAVPPLTTVDVKVETICALAVRTLYDLMQGKAPAQNVLIRPELVIRESS